MGKLFTNTGLFIMITASVVWLSSCAKEYSIEGLPTSGFDTVIIPVSGQEFKGCNLCVSSSGTGLSSWSFKIGNAQMCGEIDTAVVSPQRTAFTFYGPSSCSLDTGMVITVYLLGDTLNKDLQNISKERNVFYYYDRTVPSDILVSRQNVPFTVIIDNYDHQTKIANGRFEGNVFNATGGGTRITTGKFKVKLL